jgi:hypothetical protein
VTEREKRLRADSLFFMRTRRALGAGLPSRDAGLPDRPERMAIEPQGRIDPDQRRSGHV